MRNRDGRQRQQREEIDGLGAVAQNKGAKAVISSLWEVNDASTGALMANFYKRWADGEGKVMKVEALFEQIDGRAGPARILRFRTCRECAGASGSPGLTAIKSQLSNGRAPANLQLYLLVSARRYKQDRNGTINDLVPLLNSQRSNKESDSSGSSRCILSPAGFTADPRPAHRAITESNRATTCRANT
jgi:hypothetical protein